MSFDEAWLRDAVAASTDRAPTGLHASASLLVGKTAHVAITVDDGRIVGTADGTPECELPFSKVQAQDFVDGRFNVAVAYMRGDFKPTGSTAAILAAIDALDALNGPST